MKPWLSKTIIYGTLALVILAFLVWMCGLSPGYVWSDGHRSGTIYKLSQRGIPPYKTWEGELSIGLNEVGGDGTIMPRIWEFSVGNTLTTDASDQSIIKKLEKAEREGRRVTVHYREYGMRGRFFGDTDYVVLDVE